MVCMSRLSMCVLRCRLRIAHLRMRRAERLRSELLGRSHWHCMGRTWLLRRLGLNHRHSNSTVLLRTCTQLISLMGCEGAG